MASTWNFTITVGADFEATLTITKDGTPVDLTGYDAKMQMRSAAESPTVLLEFSLGSGILLTAAQGKVHLSKTAAETAALTFNSALYDLRLVAPDSKVLPPPISGSVTVVKMITQP